MLACKIRRLGAPSAANIAFALTVSLLLSASVPKVDASSVLTTCGGWTFNVAPTPHARSSPEFLAVSASSGTNIWAVGTSAATGLAEHSNGRVWRITPLNTPARASYTDLSAVAALSQSDAWVVGAQSLTANYSTWRPLSEHWNGSTWAPVPMPSPHSAHRYIAMLSIAAIGPKDIWAAGFDQAPGRFDKPTQSLEPTHPLIEHWNGKKWSIAATGLHFSANSRIESIWASRRGRVWVAGRVGSADTSQTHALIISLRGRTWTRIGNASKADIVSITARGPESVWMGGTSVGPSGRDQAVILPVWSNRVGENTAPTEEGDHVITGLGTAQKRRAVAVGWQRTGRASRQKIATQTYVWNESWSATQPAQIRNAVLNAVTVLSSGAAWAVGKTFSGRLLVNHRSACPGSDASRDQVESSIPRQVN